MDLICEERHAESAFVERIWHSRSDHATPFISMAQTHWSIVITRCKGTATVTVRGPETRATPAYCPAEAEFTGIMFKPGTLMPYLPANRIMDRRDVNLPPATDRKFWLNGAAWQLPDYENADTFINRLVRDGLLVHEPVVDSILKGQQQPVSLRTVQRRFLQATGLTRNTTHQIKRARYAATLLKQGTTILDTVYQTGYTDQPHLTRALKRYVGCTPGQIIAESRERALSFLFHIPPV